MDNLINLTNLMALISVVVLVLTTIIFYIELKNRKIRKEKLDLLNKKYEDLKKDSKFIIESLTDYYIREYKESKENIEDMLNPDEDIKQIFLDIEAKYKKDVLMFDDDTPIDKDTEKVIKDSETKSDIPPRKKRSDKNR